MKPDLASPRRAWGIGSALLIVLGKNRLFWPVLSRTDCQEDFTSPSKQQMTHSAFVRPCLGMCTFSSDWKRLGDECELLDGLSEVE